MNRLYFSFLITGIAGLSTLLGIIPVFIKTKNKDNIINASLAFASGVMLSVSLFSLFPESINLLQSKYNNKGIVIVVLLFIIIGVFLASLIDKVFKKIDNKLYKLGVINALALMIHNIPEGILTFSTTTTNLSLGITLALSTGSKKKAFLYTFISGFSEILGAVITYLFLYKYISNSFIGIILSLTVGIMSYISLNELLPGAIKYNNKKLTGIAFVIGFIFMLFFK